jgi:hypothetical protein
MLSECMYRRRVRHRAEALGVGPVALRGVSPAPLVARRDAWPLPEFVFILDRRITHA